mgnify:CR=1 FL=1|jgi:uncharacterized coiled-coil protein SlyX
MQINLRKASALQSDIQSIARSIRIDTRASFEERETVADDVTEAISEWRTNLERKTNLINVLYGIREKVGAANAECGLNTKLTEHRRVSEQRDLLDEIIDSVKGRMLTIEQIDEKMRKIEERNENLKDSLYSRNRDVEVFTDLMDKDDLNEYRAQIRSLKKLQRSINEEVLELNIRTHIVLSEAEVQVLRNEDLI